MRETLPEYLKILIVEDSPYIAARVQRLLADEGNHELVGIAENVSVATTLLTEKQPDVVILDIHLENEKNGFNGIDLLKSIRKNHPEVVVIMLTNFTEPFYRSKCMQLGAHYFYDKSNDFDKIPDTLKQIKTNPKNLSK